MPILVFVQVLLFSHIQGLGVTLKSSKDSKNTLVILNLVCVYDNSYRSNPILNILNNVAEEPFETVVMKIASAVVIAVLALAVEGGLHC